MKSRGSPIVRFSPRAGGQSFHQYESELAAELADLWSCLSDLDMAQAALDRLRRLRNMDSDLALETSLYCAAGIFYRRCFTSGVRKGLGGDPTSELDEETLADHDLFLAVANKHLAHSVNSFEQAKVLLVLERSEGKPVRVVGVAPGMSRLSSHNPKQLERFSRLISIIRSNLDKRLQTLLHQVATEAAQVPAEDLIALPAVEFSMIDDSRANKRR